MRLRICSTEFFNGVKYFRPIWRWKSAACVFPIDNYNRLLESILRPYYGGFGKMWERKSFDFYYLYIYFLIICLYYRNYVSLIELCRMFPFINSVKDFWVLIF